MFTGEGLGVRTGFRLLIVCVGVGGVVGWGVVSWAVGALVGCNVSIGSVVGCEVSSGREVGCDVSSGAVVFSF